MGRATTRIPWGHGQVGHADDSGHRPRSVTEPLLDVEVDTVTPRGGIPSIRPPRLAQTRGHPWLRRTRGHRGDQRARAAQLARQHVAIELTPMNSASCGCTVRSVGWAGR